MIMTQEIEITPAAQRLATIRRRNRVLALSLGFLVVLFFAISIVKMSH